MSKVKETIEVEVPAQIDFSPVMPGNSTPQLNEYNARIRS